MFSKDQLTILKKYEDRFSTAINSSFARNLGSIALNEIEEIYTSAYGQHKYNKGCSVCVLSFIKKVAERYFADTETYIKQSKELAMQQNNQTDLQTEEAPKKNKRTRKKKEDETEQQ